MVLCASLHWNERDLMALRLPPFSALRAFESAARHASFTRAATELFVTPGAISRQIASLEEFIGFPLFERTNREVKLTAAGQEYASAITDAFLQVSEATKRLHASELQKVLRISAPLTFAMRWLMPRLASFKTRYPHNEFRLTTVVPIPLKLATNDFDMGVRIFKTSPPDLIAHRLFDIEYIPVCSPRLLAAGKPLRRPADLAGHMLLHSSARPDDWVRWLEQAQVPDIDLGAGTHFETSSVAYEAAIEGIGVALAMRVLVADDLASGKLVAPFDIAYRDGSAFCICYQRKSDLSPALIAFRDWIVGEAGMPLPPLEF